MTDTPDKLRLDKWLYFARLFKSRGLAAAAVEAGVRIDGARVTKPSRTVSPGDTLTFVQGRRVRVIHVIAIGSRRGPAPEAQALYDDLTPPEPVRNRPGDRVGPAPKYEGGGRPSKKDRRVMLKSKRDLLE